jgi:uncharacterized membrane protein YkvI
MLIMNLLLIAIIILAILIILKLTKWRHKMVFVVTVIILVLLVFFYISFTVVAKNNSIDTATSEGLINAGKAYFSWFGQGFSNLKTITGQALGMDWLPENKTLSDMAPSNVMRG